jgi:hypothetical protein
MDAFVALPAMRAGVEVVVIATVAAVGPACPVGVASPLTTNANG